MDKKFERMWRREIRKRRKIWKMLKNLRLTDVSLLTHMTIFANTMAMRSICRKNEDEQKRWEAIHHQLIYLQAFQKSGEKSILTDVEPYLYETILKKG